MSDGTPASGQAPQTHSAFKQSLPNLLTILRIVIVPLIIAAFYLPGDLANWTALVFFIIASVSDFFDGYFARLYGVESALGALLDPIADKFLVLASVIMLIALGYVSGWSVLVAIVILGREILVSGLREFLADHSIKMPVTRLAKWKTGVQMTSLGFLIAGPAGDKLIYIASDIGIVTFWIAGIMTAITGAQYLQTAMRHLSNEGSVS